MIATERTVPGRGSAASWLHLLFISVKTVEANLTQIYRKLGVRSRAALGETMAPTA